MKIIQGLKEIIDQYDLYFFDLWGTIHNGEKLFPDVKEVLNFLRAKSKHIIFVSNNPRCSDKVIPTLKKFDIYDERDKIVTAGEVFYEYVKKNKLDDISMLKGRRKFYIWGTGSEFDQDLEPALPYEKVELEDAELIIIASHDKFERYERFIKLNVPMICLNPDKFVVKGEARTKFYCAGELAREYHQHGGKVYYFGKPENNIYEYSHSLYSDILKERVLMVGDSITTDIKGADSYGISSLFLDSGIAKGEDCPEATYRLDILKL